MKKKILIILVIISTLFLTGCWNYVGIDEFTIVAGIAIDKKDEENYLLTFEIIDLSNSNKETGVVTKLIQSTGKTIFDAIWDARATASNKLYFGDAMIIIINNEVARNDGISDFMNFFIRDGEIRETTIVLISKEESAAELLKTKGVTQNIISFKIMDIISDSKAINLYIKGIELYNVINILKGQGVELVLPVFKKVISNENEVVRLDGMATFKDDKLDGFLSFEEVKYFLFGIDEIGSGILTFSTEGEDNHNVTIEIKKSNTKIDYVKEDTKIKYTLKIEVEGFLSEFNHQEKLLNSKKIEELEKIAAKNLKSRIEKVISDIQKEGSYDILRLGNLIYRKDPKLWNELKKDWNNNFSTLDIKIDCKVDIKNTAFFR
ncbi:MAG: Ger(x)C family spore germination protein [Bacilli bacterium]|nr:Ger(x)C family spore germination protein [Bacilli bacterium]MDD4282173.1 Ger(x)C family spore germination protein [Bacilli bacterium]MDD4718548.1 Ger(x)C family spore germination protein [Bacilli bacterium]